LTQIGRLTWLIYTSPCCVLCFTVPCNNVCNSSGCPVDLSLSDSRAGVCSFALGRSLLVYAWSWHCAGLSLAFRNHRSRLSVRCLTVQDVSWQDPSNLNTINEDACLFMSVSSNRQGEETPRVVKRDRYRTFCSALAYKKVSRTLERSFSDAIAHNQ
jgi:hypothetical protein